MRKRIFDLLLYRSNEPLSSTVLFVMAIMHALRGEWLAGGIELIVSGLISALDAFLSIKELLKEE